MSIFTAYLAEILIKGIPETLLIVYAIYMLSAAKLKVSQYIIMASIIFCIKLLTLWLPVGFSGNKLLCLIFLAFLFAFITKTSYLKSLRNVLLTAILLSICELINITLSILSYGKELSTVILFNSSTRAIATIPSTVLFALTLLLYKKYLSKKGTIPPNGNISKKYSKKHS